MQPQFAGHEVSPLRSTSRCLLGRRQRPLIAHSRWPESTLSRRCELAAEVAFESLTFRSAEPSTVPRRPHPPLPRLPT
jgi:hypothetical protein